MPYFDFLFFAAALSLGWGLSLTSYRLFARRYGWTMGEVHNSKPMLPVLVGLLAVAVALAFAVARGGAFGGWWIVVAGLAWAVFWTGFLRVGARSALLLAPIATLALCLAWISASPPPALAAIPRAFALVRPYPNLEERFGRAAIGLIGLQVRANSRSS